MSRECKVQAYDSLKAKLPPLLLCVLYAACHSAWPDAHTATNPSAALRTPQADNQKVRDFWSNSGEQNTTPLPALQETTKDAYASPAKNYVTERSTTSEVPDTTTFRGVWLAGSGPGKMLFQINPPSSPEISVITNSPSGKVRIILPIEEWKFDTKDGSYTIRLPDFFNKPPATEGEPQEYVVFKLTKSSQGLRCQYTSTHGYGTDDLSPLKSDELETLLRGCETKDLAEMIGASLLASCANNLQLLGLVCKMYSNESAGGAYPELSSEKGNLMFVPTSVYSEYLTDARVLLCPAGRHARALLGKDVTDHKALITDDDYIYLGYAVNNDTDFEDFVSAYIEQVGVGGAFGRDLEVWMPGGLAPHVVPRVCEEKISVGLQSKIPLLFERPGNHANTGKLNVLYMDGHVEQKTCPGEFPYTPTVLKGLEQIAALKRNGGKE